LAKINYIKYYVTGETLGFIW